MRGAQSNAQIDFAADGRFNDTDTHLSKLPIFAPKEPSKEAKEPEKQGSNPWRIATDARKSLCTKGFRLYQRGI